MLFARLFVSLRESPSYSHSLRIINTLLMQASFLNQSIVIRSFIRIFEMNLQYTFARCKKLKQVSCFSLAYSYLCTLK